MSVSDLADLLDILSKKHDWTNESDKNGTVWSIQPPPFSIYYQENIDLKLPGYAQVSTTTVSIPREIGPSSGGISTGYTGKAGSNEWKFGNQFDALTSMFVKFSPDKNETALMLAYFKQASTTQLTFSVSKKNGGVSTWKYAVNTNRVNTYGNPQSPIPNINTFFQSLYTQYSWSDGKKILLDWPQLLTDTSADGTQYFKLRLGTVSAGADGSKRRRTGDPFPTITNAVATVLGGTDFRDLFPGVSVPASSQAPNTTDATDMELVESRREDDPPTKPRIVPGGVTVWDVLYELLTSRVRRLGSLKVRRFGGNTYMQPWQRTIFTGQKMSI